MHLIDLKQHLKNIKLHDSFTVIEEVREMGLFTPENF